MTVDVSSDGGTPTGQVRIESCSSEGYGPTYAACNYQALTTLNLTNGQATFDTSALIVNGSHYDINIESLHRFRATYLGDQAFSASQSDEQAVIVQMNETVVALTSNNNPSSLLEDVTFTATVTSPTWDNIDLTNNNGANEPRIIFRNNGVLIGVLNFNGGNQVSLTLDNLPEGENDISAQFIYAEGLFARSPVTTLTQTV
ncbi:hypothetical protein V0U79_13615, partial [Hyphobacterium sp. HN65]